MDAAVDWTWKELPTGEPAPEENSEAVEEERARVEAALDDAYRRGLDEGIAQGRRQARHELSTALAVANQVVDQARDAHDGWMENLEATLAALAVGIARHLVERELDADPELLGHLMSRALTHFPTDECIRVRIHPDDREALHGADPDTPVLPPERDTRWISDASVPRGSFILEGPEQVLDGRLDRALERVYRSMAGV